MPIRDMANLNDLIPIEEIERIYVANSNEATHLKLVRKLEDVELASTTFKPEMSHQIYSKTEKIFGYKNLRIELFYTAGWLRTYINLSFDRKISSSVLGIPADNIFQMLSEFLNHEFIENRDVFLNTLEEEPKFKPNGVLVKAFSSEINGAKHDYEIFHMHLSNTSSEFLRTYYDRLQRFLMWYVDGASFVEVEDDKWHYFLVYEKYMNENNEKCYGIVGLATVYEFYAYPQNKRPRISQFLILPPYQKRGLAVQLLETIYNFYKNHEDVIDIQIEDPTKDFQVIRDYVDVCRYGRLKLSDEINLDNEYKKEFEEMMKKNLKIPKRQARRLYEILLLKSITKSDEQQYTKYRLFVKKRLNAPFTKMSKIEKSLNLPEVDAQEKAEERLKTLRKKYKKLEQQYERVLNRINNSEF